MALRGAASRCFLAAVRGRAASASRVRAAPAPLPSAPPRRVPPAAFSPFAAAAARPMAAAAMMGSPAAVAARLTGHPSASVRACCELSQDTLFATRSSKSKSRGHQCVQEETRAAAIARDLTLMKLFLWSVISRWWRWPLSPSTIGGVRRPFLPPCSAPAEFSALPNPWLPTKCGDAFSQPDGSKMSTSKEEETPLYLTSRQSPSSMPLPSTNSFQPG
uniref:Uncharacterized protein n=1 Tax=Oryza nivara TaxID=4536 RepID=A0A0E0GQL8_ORYNI